MLGYIEQLGTFMPVSVRARQRPAALGPCAPCCRQRAALSPRAAHAQTALARTSGLSRSASSARPACMCGCLMRSHCVLRIYEHATTSAAGSPAPLFFTLLRGCRPAKCAAAASTRSLPRLAAVWGAGAAGGRDCHLPGRRGRPGRVPAGARRDGALLWRAPRPRHGPISLVARVLSVSSQSGKLPRVSSWCSWTYRVPSLLPSRAFFAAAASSACAVLCPLKLQCKHLVLRMQPKYLCSLRPAMRRAVGVRTGGHIIGDKKNF